MMLWAFNFFALPAQANPDNSTNIDLKRDQIDLVTIFEQIEIQAGVSFVYNTEVKDLKRKINVDYENKSLVDVMEHLAKIFGLGYKIQKSNITVYVIHKVERPVQRVLKGTVSDDTGQPLMGANVRVLGTNKGVITDFDGNFQIEVSPGDVLEFSYIGMENQNYTVESRMDDIFITLKSNNEALDEVVVIGYGEKTLESLSAAVSKVDVTALEERPLSNAAVALQGLTPGLTITRSNGRATDTPNINIRGFTSINGGEPLIIIDGVEGDINDINPNDIDNISVLKDAGAAAIYGARASFGVVLITTKQAKKGDLTINLEATTAVSQVTTNTDFVTDPFEAIKIADDFFQASNGASYSGYTEADYAALQEVSANPSLARVITDTRNGREQYIHYAKTDWWNTFFRKSRPSQIYNASISGGSEKIKGYFSYRNYREVGILQVQEDLYQKENYRAKVDFQLNDWMNITNNMQFNKFDDLQHGGFRGGWHGNYWNYLVYNHAMPWYAPMNPDGTYFYRSELNNYAAGDGLYASLLHGKSKQETEDSEFSNIITATVSPFDGFTLKSSYAFRKMNQNIYQRSTMVPWSIYVGDIQTMGSDRLTELNTTGEYDAFNLYADYNKRFGKHHIDVLVGFGQESMFSKTIEASTQGLISDDLNSLGLGTTADNANGSAYEWALQGVYSRISYDYDSRYFLEFNGRYDGTSRFPSDFRWGFFPSISGAWALHNESFFVALNPTLSQFKLRASYGTLGNQEVSPYAYQPVLNRSVNESFSLNGRPLESISSPALNPVEITWEEVRTLDFGVDLGLFANRFSANFDWFKRETIGMLTAGQVLPATLGATAPKQNSADLETKGFELSMGYSDSFMVGGSPLQFQVSAGLSNSETTITRFDNPEKLLNSFYEGMVIGDLWGYEIDGLFQTEEEIASHVDQSYVSAGIYARGGLQPGDLKYVDINGDGAVNAGTNTLGDPGDQKIVGNVAPKYLYNFRVSSSWKGFDISAFFKELGNRTGIQGIIHSYFGVLIAVHTLPMFERIWPMTFGPLIIQTDFILGL